MNWTTGVLHHKKAVQRVYRTTDAFRFFNDDNNQKPKSISHVVTHKIDTYIKRKISLSLTFQIHCSSSRKGWFSLATESES